MPMIFKVECCDALARKGKLKIGDTVYFKSRPDIPMTISEDVHYNSAAGHAPDVEVTWISHDHEVKTHRFDAILLTL